MLTSAKVQLVYLVRGEAARAEPTVVRTRRIRIHQHQTLLVEAAARKQEQLCVRAALHIFTAVASLKSESGKPRHGKQVKQVSQR